MIPANQSTTAMIVVFVVWERGSEKISSTVKHVPPVCPFKPKAPTGVLREAPNVTVQYVESTCLPPTSLWLSCDAVMVFMSLALQSGVTQVTSVPFVQKASPTWRVNSGDLTDTLKNNQCLKNIAIIERSSSAMTATVEVSRAFIGLA